MDKTRYRLKERHLFFWYYFCPYLYDLGEFPGCPLPYKFLCDIELSYSISNLKLNLLIRPHNDDCKKGFSRMTSVCKVLADTSNIHLKTHLMSAYSVLSAIHLHRFLKHWFFSLFNKLELKPVSCMTCLYDHKTNTQKSWFIGPLDKIWLLDFRIHTRGLHIFNTLRNTGKCQMILIACFRILPDDARSSSTIRKTRQCVSVCILGFHLGSCVLKSDIVLNLFLQPRPF